ncbi:MAG: hypothetical protein WHS38_09770 [Thermodesulforhabdaceae bacterium]
MNFSIRRYYTYLLVEGLLGLTIAFVIGALLGHFLATSNLGWLSLGKKTLWWDFSWIRQKSPWGFLIMFFLGTGLVAGALQALWAFSQWLGCLFVSRTINKYNDTDHITAVPVTDGFRTLLHPFRRVACLLSNSPKSQNSLPSIALFDQRQRFLAEGDRRMLTFPWKLVKFFVAVSVLTSWFLSLFVFYKYTTTIVSGQSAVNNLWTYFSSSFRIFVHIFYFGLVVIGFGFVANRFVQLYLMHLDNLVYDEVLPRLETSQVRGIEEIQNLLAKLNEKIEKLEQIIKVSASNTLRK